MKTKPIILSLSLLLLSGSAVADDDCDGRLNVKEFCMAMHMVTCVKRYGIGIDIVHNVKSLPEPSLYSFPL